MKRGLFAGSFDPFTVGHKSIVDESLKLFDEVIIAIGVNPNKKRVFDEKYIKIKLEELYKDKNVKIISYNTLTSKLAKELGVDYLIRGVRNTLDFEYEKNLAEINKKVFGVETILLFGDMNLSYVSSTMVRELYRYGENCKNYLPFEI